VYPVRIGFDEVLQRISALQGNGHHAEALVTSVFTLEKLMRRGMRMAILSRGFTSKHATHLLDRKGFRDLREMWDVFDKEHQSLPNFIGQQTWRHVPEAVDMRNHLVHGQEVYSLAKCETYARHVVAALSKLHGQISTNYGHDPWAKLTARKVSKLPWME
jgi:hypothetical protein